MDSTQARLELPRQRLADLLAERFEHRLTVLTGGAGVGKTTALAQVQSPSDVLIECNSIHSDPETLLRLILNRLGRRTGGPVDARDIADAVLARAPEKVCLMLDDVHRLDGPSALVEVLEHLPLNGHMLLSSRTPSPIPVARLDAAGQLLEVGEESLRFSSDEIDAFAKLRGINAKALAELDGWPAFMALASNDSTARSRRYLAEEVVASLDDSARRAIATLSLSDGCDDGFVEAVTGWDPDNLMAALPLARRTSHGWQLHDLWGELLDDELDADARSQAVSRGVKYWIAQGDPERAMQAALNGRDQAAFRSALAAACLRPTSGRLVGSDLERWLSLAPPDALGTPEFLLASGLLARERDPGGDQCVELLTQSIKGFKSQGHVQLEAETSAHLGYPLYLRGDLMELAGLLERAQVLAEQGASGIEGWNAFSVAVVALQAGDHAEVVRVMQGVQPAMLPDAWLGVRRFLIARSLLALGRPGEAIDYAQDGQGPMAVPGSHAVLGAALWYSGAPDAAMKRGPVGYGPEFGARDRFLAAAYVAVAWAFAGRHSEALEALDVAKAAAGPAPTAIVGVRLRHSTNVTRHVITGDPEALADMRALVAEEGLGHPGGEMLLQQVAWHYVTMPELRDWIRAQPLGPSHAQALDLAAATVSCREAGPEILESFDWPPPGIIAANLPVAWAAELAVAGASVDRPEAIDLAEWICEHWGRPARDAMLKAGNTPEFTKTARRLLSNIPSPPADPVRLCVLGPMELRLDNTATPSTNWRRERVRALALYMASRRVARRATVAGELWPELDQESAGQNLRTTLALLNSVLEPSRAKGDAPWFLRTNGDTISLHESLSVDLWDFEAAAANAEAAQATGRGADAMVALDQAAALWRGPLADGAIDQEWSDNLSREVSDRFVALSLRLAELRASSGDFAGSAEAARAVLTADRWNEPAHLIAAESEAANGNEAAALKLREQLRRRLEELSI